MQFSISQTGGRGKQEVAELQAFSLTSNAVIGSRVLTAEDLPPGKPKAFQFPFAAPGGEPIESRVYVTGKATVEAGRASAIAVAIQPNALDDKYPDGSLMAAWVGGTILLGAVLAYALYLKRRLMRHEVLT